MMLWGSRGIGKLGRRIECGGECSDRGCRGLFYGSLVSWMFIWRGNWDLYTDLKLPLAFGILLPASPSLHA